MLYFIEKKGIKGMGFKVKTTESKVTPSKKNLELKNISVNHLHLVDIDTGEDITEKVIAEIPNGIKSIDFKLVFELPDKEESDE